VLIRMRRDGAKNFSGGVFVELRSEEDVERILEEKIPVNPRTDLPVDGEEGVKRQKGEERCLVVRRKAEYVEEKERRSEEKKKEDARRALEEEFVPRLFRYESKDELGIGDVRKLVKDTAFVDAEKKVVRMKSVEDFKERRYEGDGKEVVLTKMEEADALEYCKGINVGPKKAKPKTKRRK